MPCRARDLCRVIHYFVWLIKRVEILHSRIEVIFPWPELAMVSIPWKVALLESCQFVVAQSMFWTVPSTKAEIDSTCKRHTMVDDHDFLVMSPEKGILFDLIR